MAVKPQKTVSSPPKCSTVLHNPHTPHPPAWASWVDLHNFPLHGSAEDGTWSMVYREYEKEGCEETDEFFSVRYS